jgi:hypothetical protein
MKVFDDLIEELKEENLIEEAVFEQTNASTPENGQEKTASDIAQSKVSKPITTVQNELFPNKQSDSILQSITNTELHLPSDENDFYRQRAMEEVSALKLVELIFSAVEREQAKISPKPYDDLPVSKALHDFLQVSKNPNSPESAAAEFKLMQETESWYSALAHRDQNILPVHLRRYCETTRPALSSQAQVSLARFYRNSPYSESVRSKFDLIVTRLFSKEVGTDERFLVFEYDDLVQHLSELYADWSSIPLYSTDDDSELSIIVPKFEDFINEARSAADFEELVKTDFFNRLRSFKESTGENFYAPTVTATAINCNIKVGNRYVELLREEKKKNNGSKLEEKYKFLLDHTISEATSKTLQLVQLLKEKRFEPSPVAAPKPKAAKIKFDFPDEKPVAAVKKESGTTKSKHLRANKWLIALTLFTVIATSALYTWVEFVTPKASTKEVQVLELDGYYFKEYIKVAKITNETLIGVTNPSWFQISEDKKTEVLKNIISVGKEKGFKTVQLLNNEGKTVGYISTNNITQPYPSSPGN